MQGDTRGCKGVRRDGRPCSAPALLSSGYCFTHYPDNQDAVARSHAAGGHAKSRTARTHKRLPSTLRPVLDRLLDAMGKVEGGDLAPAQAQALAALAGAALRVYTAGELEQRLAALEAAQPGMEPA